MQSEVTRQLRDLANEVLKIQDASNLSGLVHSWSRAVTDLRKLLINASTLSINTHPINTMWLEKLCQLNGCLLEPNELVTEASDEVKKIAEM